MNYDDYDYYNSENIDELYNNNIIDDLLSEMPEICEAYYDNGVDEPWMGTDSDENDVMDNTGWDNYYHNITDELIDD
jgi:hypothetical protein